jgi:hypothetical protein
LSYSVKFRQIGGLVPSELSTPSLAAAIRIAMDGVDSNAAKRAEIRNAEDEIVFVYPDEDER